MQKQAYLSIDWAYQSSTYADKQAGAGYYATVQSVVSGHEIAGPYGPFASKKATVHKAVLAVNEARIKGWRVNGIDKYMAELA